MDYIFHDYTVRSIFVQLHLGADFFQDRLPLYFLIISPQDKSSKTIDVTVSETKSEKIIKEREQQKNRY